MSLTTQYLDLASKTTDVPKKRGYLIAALEACLSDNSHIEIFDVAAACLTASLAQVVFDHERAFAARKASSYRRIMPYYAPYGVLHDQIVGGYKMAGTPLELVEGPFGPQYQ